MLDKAKKNELVKKIECVCNEEKLSLAERRLLLGRALRSANKQLKPQTAVAKSGGSETAAAKP